MSKKLPPATDWHARNIDDWNATTFRRYLSDKHEELYGIPYITRSIPMEAKLIRSMIDQHGEEVTRQFIDECFRQYKPNPDFPSTNFTFMYMWMRDRVLPKLLAEKSRQERMSQVQPVISDEELTDWL